MKLIVLFIFTLSSALFAKNLDGRVGFGFDYHDFNATTCLGLRYYMSQYVHMTFLGGFDTSDSKNTVVLGAKLYRNAHIEENLNLYLGVGAMTVADKNNSTNVVSGLEFDGLLGAEFFLSGLPNLGFQFETGLAVRTIRVVGAKTIGGGFMNAGIHYYF
jgi:hypothetical protein